MEDGGRRMTWGPLHFSAHSPARFNRCLSPLTDTLLSLKEEIGRDWLIKYQCYVMEDVDLAGLELSIPGLRGNFWFRCIVCFYTLPAWIMYTLKPVYQTSQELRMLSSVTLKCQITKIVVNSGSQLSEL